MSETAPTLSDIMQGAFDDLGQLVTGVATGGGASTIVDSALKGRDDSWNKGTAFIPYDAAGNSAPPENEFARITDYARTSGTISASFSADVAAGDHYALASRKWTSDDMIAIVNRALKRMGHIPKVDESLTASSGQTEYTLPAGFKVGPRRVYLLQSTATDDEKPMRMTDWYPQNGILIFRRQPAAGVLRLVGKGAHERLSLFGDTLDESVALELAIAQTVVHALRWIEV